LLVGLVSGWIASILVRGSTRVRGCLAYMVVGMIGALLGGYLFDAIGLNQVGSVVTATVGAIVLLVLLNIVRNA
jgi:uncharacterized membrane protein YeaQ/YmgE (transglycosylase-associated protein family)